MNPLLLLIVFVCGYLGCEGVSFQDEINIAHIRDSRLTSPSGLAASRKHRGVLYTHNDSNKPEPFVYAINESTAAIISTLRLFPAENRNWEDIAVGPCGDKTCMYLGDSRSHQIYRAEEPDYIYSDQILTDVATVRLNLTYSFSSLMVDRHGNLFIVQSHTDDDRLIGRLPANKWSSSQKVDLETSHLPQLPRIGYSEPKSGDISPDGSQLLLLSHHHVFYWEIHGDDVMGSLQQQFTVLPTKTSHVVKGISWDAEGRNYYEISVGNNITVPSLYLYNRI